MGAGVQRYGYGGENMPPMAHAGLPQYAPVGRQTMNRFVERFRDGCLICSAVHVMCLRMYELNHQPCSSISNTHTHTHTHSLFISPSPLVPLFKKGFVYEPLFILPQPPPPRPGRTTRPLPTAAPAAAAPATSTFLRHVRLVRLDGGGGAAAVARAPRGRRRGASRGRAPRGRIRIIVGGSIL